MAFPAYSSRVEYQRMSSAPPPINTTPSKSSETSSHKRGSYPPSPARQPSNGSDNFIRSPLSGPELRTFALEQVGDPLPKKPMLRTPNWSMMPFQRWFAILLVSSHIILFIILQVVLALSNRHHGFASGLTRSGNLVRIHWTTTAVVVVLSLPIPAVWSWLDCAIKSVQPYLELSHGVAVPAERSVLLNYVGCSQFLVIPPALWRRHYFVVLSSSLVILTLAVYPVASALLVVAAVSVPRSNVSSISLVQLGLSPDLATMEANSDASAFTLARARYHTPWPPFVDGNGAVGEWELSPSWGRTGTVTSHAVAIKTFPNCVTASVLANLAANTVTSTFDGCEFSMNYSPVTSSNSTVYAVGVAACPGVASGEHSPAVFASASNGPAGPSFNSIYCVPSFQVRSVTAGVDLSNGTLLPTQQIGVVAMNSTNPLAQPPLDGRPFNGIAPLSSITDQAINARLQSSITNLAQAFAFTVDNSTTLASPSSMLNAVNIVYGCYLDVYAQSSYFVRAPTQSTAVLAAKEVRIVISSLATHLLTAILLTLAACGSYLFFAHGRARRDVCLPAEPSTIASATAVAGNSELAYLIEAKDDPELTKRVLEGHRFTLDKGTGRIIVQQKEEMAEDFRRRRTFSGQ